MKKPPADKKAPAAKTTRRTTTTSKRAPAVPPTDAQRLREAVAPYLSLRRLQHLVAFEHQNLRAALLTDDPPLEVQAMLHVLAALMLPDTRQPVTRPADVAALLVVEMSGLLQEQVRVVCLDTQHRIQTIHTVYNGTLHSAGVRLGELFREPLRRNSAAIILVHNHPSGDLTPSQQDLLITREATLLGKQLDIPVLDHLIIGHGQWLSMGMEYPRQAES
jgi:DNA repair protein RadC